MLTAGPSSLRLGLAMDWTESTRHSSVSYTCSTSSTTLLLPIAPRSMQSPYMAMTTRLQFLQWSAWGPRKKVKRVRVNIRRMQIVNNHTRYFPVKYVAIAPSGGYYTTSMPYQHNNNTSVVPSWHRWLPPRRPSFMQSRAQQLLLQQQHLQPAPISLSNFPTMIPHTCPSTDS